MSARDDGGNAFPAQEFHKINDNEFAVGYHTGMSLRDYFAAKVLPQIQFGNMELAKRGGKPMLFDEVAECAYRLADAMILERSKP